MTPYALGMDETVEQAEERCAEIEAEVCRLRELTAFRQCDHSQHVKLWIENESWRKAVVYNEYIARQRDELV